MNTNEMAFLKKQTFVKLDNETSNQFENISGDNQWLILEFLKHITKTFYIHKSRISAYKTPHKSKYNQHPVLFIDPISSRKEQKKSAEKNKRKWEKKIAMD